MPDMKCNKVFQCGGVLVMECAGILVMGKFNNSRFRQSLGSHSGGVLLSARDCPCIVRWCNHEDHEKGRGSVDHSPCDCVVFAEAAELHCWHAQRQLHPHRYTFGETTR